MMMRYVGCLVLMMSITNLGVENVFGFQEEVDWIWNDVKSTARQGPACMKYIVKAYLIKIFRENVSGRTCLTHSIDRIEKVIMKRP